MFVWDFILSQENTELYILSQENTEIVGMLSHCLWNMQDMGPGSLYDKGDSPPPPRGPYTGPPNVPLGAPVDINTLPSSFMVISVWSDCLCGY